MTRPFRRVPGGVELHFDPGLAGLLADVPRALSSVGRTPGDPAADRLRVPVYLDDPASSQEWWSLMGGELDQSRAADRSAFAELVEAAVEGTVASMEEAQAFLRVLVEMRLVVAARLGVEVEEDYDQLPEAERVLLGALGELQVLLLRELGPG